MNRRMRKFWMVRCTDRDPSYVQHATKRSATDEAIRLARKHPGDTFFVLETIGCAKVVPQPVQYIDFDDEIPF